MINTDPTPKTQHRKLKEEQHRPHTKNTTQKTKKMSNTDPTPKTVENANKKMLRLIPDNLFLFP